MTAHHAVASDSGANRERADGGIRSLEGWRGHASTREWLAGVELRQRLLGRLRNPALGCSNPDPNTDCEEADDKVGSDRFIHEQGCKQCRCEWIGAHGV